MPPITEFSDYRVFLRAWVLAKPRRSQRGLAKRLGEVSCPQVNMVFSGKRNLMVDDAEAWGRAMFLSDDELTYWIAMVRAKEGSDLERREAQLEMRARRAFARARRMPVEKDVFSRWYTWAVLELARCDGFRAEAAWVAETLRPAISCEDARRALEALLDAGFLDKVDGVVRATSLPVVIPDAIDRERIERLKRLHREQLSYAGEALELPASERHVVTMMVAVSADALSKLAPALNQAVREAVEGASGGTPSRVYQVSIQIVPRSTDTA